MHPPLSNLKPYHEKNVSQNKASLNTFAFDIVNMLYHFRRDNCSMIFFYSSFMYLFIYFTQIEYSANLEKILRCENKCNLSENIFVVQHHWIGTCRKH